MQMITSEQTMVLCNYLPRWNKQKPPQIKQNKERTADTKLDNTHSDALPQSYAYSK